MSKISENMQLKKTNKEIWWFKLENNRGESNVGKLYAETISKSYINRNIKIKANNPFSEQLTGLYLFQKYFRVKATIIFVHSRANIIFLILSKFLNQKSILIVHDYMRYHNDDKKLISKIKSLYHKILHDISLRYCDKFIFNSKTTYKKSHLNIINKKAKFNYKIIHPLPTYHPRFIKSSLKIDNKETIDIILVTGKTKNKNPELTLDIAKKISDNKKNKNIIFHIFGLDDFYKKKNYFSKNIIFYKKNTPIEKLFQVHQICEFYFSLSNDEGFGIPLLESIYLGLFPIISKIDSYLEILSTNANIIDKSLIVNLSSSRNYIIDDIYNFINLNYINARINKSRMQKSYVDLFNKRFFETRHKLKEIIE